MAQWIAMGFSRENHVGEAKNAFGLMIDTARAEPVLIEKHGRGVVVVAVSWKNMCGFPCNLDARTKRRARPRGR